MAFEKGKSGNPNGRPKNPSHALGDVMLGELKRLFDMHGKKILTTLVDTDPKAFLDVCVKVLPKEINVSGSVDHNHSVTVAAERVDEILAALSQPSGEARDVSEAVH